MKKTILFLFVISLFSCKKDGFDEAPVPFDVLGSWQWVSKSGGFAGEFIKVDSTQQYILTILPNKEFIWCKNGDCSIGSWSYVTQLSNNQKNTMTLMKFSKPNRADDFPMIAFSFFTPIVKNDTINFSPYCNDCFGFEFKRFKK
jgi:hypothetical protein